MRRSWLQVTLLCTLASSSCAPGDSGVDQPFRVRNAQFFAGALPGFIPTGDGTRTPRVTALETANLNVRQGQGGKMFSGRAEASASSIAVALDGVGSGYWVVPTGSIDTATEELTWSVSTDFDVSIRAGRYALQVVAIDDTGHAGDQLLQSLCVSARVPDNGRACSDTAAPPRAVVSLQWDSNVDLDLQLATPGGETIGAKQTAADGGSVMETAVLDRDSNPACALDGTRTENVVWNDDTPVGTYRIYVNLFDACKQTSVRFSVDVYTAEDTDDGSAPLLVRHLHRSGELLDLAANPRGPGLFVTDVTFN